MAVLFSLFISFLVLFSSSLSWQQALLHAFLLSFNNWSSIITTHWLFWLRGPDRITSSVSYTLFLAVLTVPGGSVKIANHLHSSHHSSHAPTVVLLLLHSLNVPAHHSPLRLVHSRVLGRPVTVSCLLHPVTSSAGLPGSDLLRLFHLHTIYASISCFGY